MDMQLSWLASLKQSKNILQTVFLQYKVSQFYLCLFQSDKIKTFIFENKLFILL